MYCNWDVTFSVFTPTYNREDLLPRVFESLQVQTFCDFEWIIVDDGSTDNTSSLVERFRQESRFPVQYIRQENQGKHIAINTGVQAAKGYFFAIMDSDDWYVEDAFEKYVTHWEAIPDDKKEKFLGVCGLFAYESGGIVGTKFPEDIMDADDFEMRYKYKVEGDKISVIRTELMRKFPFPDNLGRFVPESIVWYKMARHYQTRFVNDVMAIKEYQADGLTDQGRLLHASNPEAARLARFELLSAGKKIPVQILLKTYVNYVRSSFLAGVGARRQVVEVPSKSLWALTFPLGCCLAVRDRFLLRRLN